MHNHPNEEVWKWLREYPALGQETPLYVRDEVNAIFEQNVCSDTPSSCTFPVEAFRLAGPELCESAVNEAASPLFELPPWLLRLNSLEWTCEGT